ncbi:CHU domain-containing protein [Tenacibaculum adriaticum]|uniref:CHU domain-containing protein n=1 Tax=Tenacibaculum adriaticum TaxID=413713 RepID=A0A5S5DQG0_9FLAO|nr:gliding motility-associated C-terminal domain-containing protein [Tenacibaculum adriaticum]TYP97072.1 CHU domain-containing protein [Tenacibaculum adriaticum]
MCKHNPLTLKHVLGLFVLLFSSGLFSQELQIPEVVSTTNHSITLDHLCASSGFNNFTVKFSWGVPPHFNADNIFYIDLYDADDNLVGNVGSITNKNFDIFDVTGTFSLPTDTYGTGYRIRIRATSPEMTGPPSEPFEAYYRPDVSLILNGNNQNVVLCGSTPTEISLNTDDTYEYIWYFNDNPIAGETGPTLMVSAPGVYYALIEAGQCSDSYQPSNSVTVSSLDVDDVSIEGDNTVEICADDTYTLVSSVDDASYLYEWYKDGDLIVSADEPTYTTPVGEQFGVYHLEVTVSGCTVSSQEVTIQQQTGANFDFTIDSALTRIKLPCESFVLTVEDNLTSATYTWFKNGAQLGATSNNFNVTAPGEYYVVVTDTSGACPFSKESEVYTVLGVDNLVTVIRTDYDADCTAATTKLSIVGIKASATDGNQYDLSTSQIDSFNFQWFKDGAAVSGATANELNIDSYNDNGAYQLNVSGCSLSSDSEPLSVLLTLDVEIQSSSPSNSVCPGGTIDLSVAIEPGFTYTWYKDDVEITVTDPSTIEVSEIGEYYVTFEGFGCLNTVPSVEIVEFDASVLEVSPSTTAILTPGETTTLTASGADSYEWYNEAGTLLSTNEQLEVNRLGNYTLIGTVGNCTVEKIIQVVEDDGKLMIPNVLSPFNGDGVNDTWELPNRLAFQPNVTVIIYNSRGKEVLNTTDYQNNWPEDNNLKDGAIFYFKVIKDNSLVKAGTISVLE